MRALHHSAPGLGPGVTLGSDLLATRAQVQGEAEFLSQGARFVVVEALVQTEVLRSLPCWPGPLDGDSLKCRPHQLMVVAIGSIDGCPKRHAAAVGQHHALHPAFAAVRRVAAGFSPHPARPCPSLRPAPTRSSRCPAGRRRPAGPRPRTPRTPRPQPIPESAGAPRRTNRSSSHAAHSTDTQSAAQRRSRPSPPGPAPAGCGSPAGGAVAVAAVPPS